MTPFTFILIILSQVCAVTGQVFLKKSVTPAAHKSRKRGIMLRAIGIGSMAVGFFLWLGLMSKFQLSYLFPFEGIHYILIVVAAGIFLRERASMTLWIGVVLISTGVALVASN